MLWCAVVIASCIFISVRVDILREDISQPVHTLPVWVGQCIVFHLESLYGCLQIGSTCAV